MSISTVLNDTRRQKSTIGDLEYNLRGLRIQLCGNWPVSEDKTAEPVAESITHALMIEQSNIDMLLSLIDEHISAINDALGGHFHPNCDKETADDSPNIIYGNAGTIASGRRAL